MLFKKKIIVTIGYNGTVIAFHDAKSVSKKFFFEKFDAESVAKLTPYFKDYKRHNISILLDTIDQTYKKKSFPSVRKTDLKNLARRELGGVSNKETLKSFIAQSIIKEKNREGNFTKRWDTILITASISEEISEWIEFLFEMPNMIEGIYTVPIESFSIIKKIKKKEKLEAAIKLKKEKKEKKKNADDIKDKLKTITCLVIYTKTNGFRQIIFTKHGIEFTRIVNYDLEGADFIKNYEQDIYSSFQYLKRSIHDIKITDIEIINIMPPKLVEKLKTINNEELNIKSYTPSEMGRILGFGNSIISKGSEFCDLLLSRSLFKFKKLLKFRIPKMIATSKMYMMMQSSYYLYLFLIIFFFVEFLININIRIDFDNKINDAEVALFKATEELHNIQNKVLNTTNDEGKTINIEQAIDIGKINDVLGMKSDHIFSLYKDLQYIKKYDLLISNYRYTLQDYREEDPEKKSSFNMSFNGKIYNKSGNIDDLFNEFDSLDKDTKDQLKNFNVTFSKIPRNIDFNKKYYEFPLDFTISSK